MLKTSENIESAIRLREDIVEVSDNNRARRDKSKRDGNKIDNNEVSDCEVDDEVGKKGQETFKFKNLFKSRKLSKSKETVRSSDFLTPKTKLAFTKLRQMFFKVLILHHFDLECQIRIETDISGYTIDRVFS